MNIKYLYDVAISANKYSEININEIINISVYFIDYNNTIINNYISYKIKVDKGYFVDHNGNSLGKTIITNSNGVDFIFGFEYKATESGWITFTVCDINNNEFASTLTILVNGYKIIPITTSKVGSKDLYIYEYEKKCIFRYSYPSQTIPSEAIKKTYALETNIIPEQYRPPFNYVRTIHSRPELIFTLDINGSIYIRFESNDHTEIEDNANITFIWYYD